MVCLPLGISPAMADRHINVPHAANDHFSDIIVFIEIQIKKPHYPQSHRQVVRACRAFFFAFLELWKGGGQHFGGLGLER